jgi:hypothetical protein
MNFDVQSHFLEKKITQYSVKIFFAIITSKDLDICLKLVLHHWKKILYRLTNIWFPLWQVLPIYSCMVIYKCDKPFFERECTCTVRVPNITVNNRKRFWWFIRLYWKLGTMMLCKLTCFTFKWIKVLIVKYLRKQVF